MPDRDEIIMNTKTKRRTILALTTSLTLVACAQPMTSVRVDPNTRDIEDSVFYALPRTKVVVTAELTAIESKVPKCVRLTKMLETHTPKSAQQTGKKKTEKKAEKAPPSNAALWAAYVNAGFEPAELPTKRVVKFGQSNIAVTTVARPDPSQIFAIKLEGKAAHNRSMALELGVDGLIFGGDVSAKDRGGEIAVAVVVDVLSAVATIAGSFFGATDPSDIEEKPDIDASLQELPEFDLCYQALERLKILSDSRGNLIDGTTERVPVDIADQLKILDDERGRIDRLFTGEREIRKGAVVCVLDPKKNVELTDANPNEPFDLWMYAKDAGIEVLAADSCFVTPGFVVEDVGSQASKMSLELSTKDYNKYAETARSTYKKSNSPTVIHYRVPGQASVSVVEDGTKVRFGPEVVTIAQYGIVLPLPVPGGNKKVDVSFKLDEETGALIKVGVATGGDDAELPDIGEIGEAVGSLGATIQDEREESKSEIAKNLLVETCIAALEAGEWALACGEL